jgi:hypothetical protein
MRYDKNPLCKCGTTGEREGEMPGRQKPVLDKKMKHAHQHRNERQ